MFLEFVYGAVSQFGRFVGGLPRSFGWSSAAAPDTTGGIVCGSLACSSTVTGTLACAASVTATLACSSTVTGTLAITEC